MGAVWQAHDKTIYLDWCNAILSEASEKLNEWELAFVQDIKEKCEKNWFRITQRQAEKLELIYSEKTA